MPESAEVRKNGLLSWFRLRLRLLVGKLYNLAGIPGLVRDCDYSAAVSNARIQVRVGDLFTVVSVNGLDIYFHRLTGSIDGVGISGAPSCTSASILESGQLPEPSSFAHHTSRKHTS